MSRLSKCGSGWGCAEMFFALCIAIACAAFGLGVLFTVLMGLWLD